MGSFYPKRVKIYRNVCKNNITRHTRQRILTNSTHQPSMRANFRSSSVTRSPTRYLYESTTVRPRFFLPWGQLYSHTWSNSNLLSNQTHATLTQYFAQFFKRSAKKECQFYKRIFVARRSTIKKALTTVVSPLHDYFCDGHLLDIFHCS